MTPVQRPAETGGAAGAVALLASRLAGVRDPNTLTSIGAVAGFVPAAITWLVVTLRKPPPPPTTPSPPGTPVV